MSAAPEPTDAPSIVPIFAVPFGVLPLPAGPGLNPQLRALLAARAAADGAGDPHCYHSRDDLFAWPDPVILELKTAIYQGVFSFLSTINDFTPAELQAFQPESRASYAIVRPDGYVGSRNFGLAAWCGVYCVAGPGPEAAGDRRDSGLLRLHETRLGTAFADATNAAMRLPYTTGHFSWRPVPGSLALFPAYVTHEIATLRAPEELVLVTLRIRFTAPGQTGMGRW